MPTSSTSSYFTNFVLLASFLGIGVGFLRAAGARSLFAFAPLASPALVAFVRFFPVKRGAACSGGRCSFVGGSRVVRAADLARP